MPEKLANPRLRTLLAALALSAAACRGSDPPPPPAPVNVIVPPAAVTASAPAAPAAPPAPRLPPDSRTLDPPRADYIRAHYVKYEYRIPMRDGVHLFTAVYVPIDAAPARRYPFLLMRTPYSIAPYGLDRYRGRLGPTDAYERDGYIFALQDVRGEHMSEGEFVNMRPQLAGKRGPKDIDESTDTHDTIEWLLHNVPNNSGRVGMWGISYPGFYASAGAIDSHPALVAVSPQAPIADWFRGDDMHRHGALNLQLAFAFFSGFGRPRPRPTDEEESEPFDFGTPDAYDFFLRAGPLPELEKRYFKGEIPFWTEVASHPDYDAFWQARNLLPHLKNIRAATMVVGGWFDTEDLYGPLATYKAIEANNPGTHTLVMGPWSHGGWVRTWGDALGDASFGFPTSETYQALELAFFQHHLKGKEDPRLPEAMVFETGANRWRRFDAWPPREAKTARLYLREAGSLSFEPVPAGAGAGPGFDEYLSDPARPVPYTQEMTPRWSKTYMTEDQRFAARRPDVLVYATPPLEREVTLAGPLEAELYVSTTGTDADFVVKLIDAYPGKLPGWSKADEQADKPNRGGQQTLVRGEPFRARYREGYEKSVPFQPGAVTRVVFPINDVFHTFQRGHRIMVQVQSSWFPFIDRNPQRFVPSIYAATAADFIKANHRVHRTAAAPSALRVSILPAADE
ncbi:MAG TPA: CocE/NonD family hydrolase [Kofleriaceae bacterium]|nr:CocE/NonD family hydrolase [Kofleriaceae bacterium]